LENRPDARPRRDRETVPDVVVTTGFEGNVNRHNQYPVSGTLTAVKEIFTHLPFLRCVELKPSIPASDLAGLF
jgi:hypothetical protein